MTTWHHDNNCARGGTPFTLKWSSMKTAVHLKQSANGPRPDPPTTYIATVKASAEGTADLTLVKSNGGNAHMDLNALELSAPIVSLLQCISDFVFVPAYNQCKASSVRNRDPLGTGYGKGILNSPQAWSAARKKSGEWWQIDLGRVRPIVGVKTQGRKHSREWVTRYTVQISVDGKHWRNVDDKKQFKANFDFNSIVRNNFTNVVEARHVRITETGYHVWPSMRVALQLGSGCTAAISNTKCQAQDAAARISQNAASNLKLALPSDFKEGSRSAGHTFFAEKLSGGDVASSSSNFVSAKPSIKQIGLRRPTSQSSTCCGGPSARAVDGNTNGKYGSNSCTHTHNQHGAWWKVSLGNKYAIDRVVVWNRADCCQGRLNHFEVLVNSRVCGKVGTAKRSNTIRCNGAQGTSVTVRLRGNNYLTLCEVQVFGRDIVSADRFDPAMLFSADPSKIWLSARTGAKGKCAGACADWRKQPASLTYSFAKAAARWVNKMQLTQVPHRYPHPVSTIKIYYWDNVDGRWYPVQSPTKTGFSQQSITWGQKIEIGFGLVKSSKFRIELYAHPRSPIPTKIGLAAWAIFGPRTIVCTGATQGARARAHTHT